jgi:hypothetical protein
MCVLTYLFICSQMQRVENGTQIRKLGLLAGTFEDGSLSIYAVPYPADLSRSNKTIFGELWSVSYVWQYLIKLRSESGTYPPY